MKLYANDEPCIVADGRWNGNFGIGRYSTEMLSRLSRVDNVIREGPRPASHVDPFFLSCRLRAVRGGILYSPGFNAAVGSKLQLLTVHDLIHLQYDDESSRSKRSYYQFVVGRAILRAGMVMTVSEFSQTKISNWLGLPKSAIHIASPGLAPALAAPLTSIPAVHTDRQTLDAPERFYLFVGNDKPHKNLDSALRLMTRLRDVALVTVGVSPQYCAARQHCLGTAANVTHYKNITDAALSGLYRRAELLLFTSEYEGFGLPALEALAQGTPCLFQSEAVREIVGDLGVSYPRGCGVEEMVQLADRASQMRSSDKFKTMAMNRANDYTWGNAAQVVDSALASLHEQGRARRTNANGANFADRNCS